MAKEVDDAETIRHVIETLEQKYPQVPREELEAVVNEEFGLLAGRPVRDYLEILTERAARKRLKLKKAAKKS
ncbi:MULTISPECIES: hypothetical protein [unclassified Salinibacterium]|uniref:three-helix bundle dimerization domain-containing protein n=1 Tax=unclassified Salinibacterium TaxID=2632331 RepID=UPI001420B835|nr:MULTISPECIES: hypothetical protein [unclassified Salinibacterium]